MVDNDVSHKDTEVACQYSKYDAEKQTNYEALRIEVFHDDLPFNGSCVS